MKSMKSSSAFCKSSSTLPQLEFSNASFARKASQTLLRTHVQELENKRKRVLLRTTTDRESITFKENELSAFNWYKQWWPAQVIYNLETDRPNRIQLLGEYFAVWKSKNGEWIAMKDSCPHKLAPLSEGRIEDGTIMCSYHGWRFDEKGKCVRIPQEDNEERLKAACSNPRSCATMHPCKSAGQILWIWTDDSVDNMMEAENSPLPIQEEHIARLEEMGNIIKRRLFTTVLPYPYEILTENILDPAHVFFAHHNKPLGSKREKAGPIPMKLKENPLPRSVASIVTGFTQRSAVDFDLSIDFIPPATYSGTMAMFKTQFYFFFVPVDSWRSRIVTATAFNNGGFTKYRTPIWNTFLWTSHMARNETFCTDNVLLHYQAKRLKRNEEAQFKPETYFTPASCDLLTIQFRKWMERKGGRGPKIPGSIPDVSNEKLLDRYWFHTQECKVCQEGLAFCKRIATVANLLAVPCLVGSVGFLIKSLKGNFPYWKTSLILIPALIFWSIYYFFEKILIPKFYYVHFSHAEND